MTSSYEIVRYDRPSVRSTFHVSQYAKCRSAGPRVLWREVARVGPRVFFGGKLHGLDPAFWREVAWPVVKQAKVLKTTKNQSNYFFKYVVQRGKKRKTYGKRKKTESRQRVSDAKREREALRP